MMAEKYNWSIAITKLLITEYEKNEMLYNTRHPDYKNRDKRHAIYKSIVNNLNHVQGGLTIKEAKRKINGLRSQYLNEKLKISKSQKSGVDRDDVYQPTAYWYPLMKFLEVGTDADTSNSNVDEIEENSSASLPDKTAISIHNEAATPNLSSAVDEAAQTVISTGKYSRKRKSAKDYDDLLNKATKTMNDIVKVATAGDEFEFFGQFVANEMRAIKTASDSIVYRQAKRKVQMVLIETWDQIDETPRPSTSLSFMPISTNFENTIKEELFE